MNDSQSEDAMDQAGQLHRELAEMLRADGSIRSPRVEEAFRAIPRHLFLPGIPLEKAYQNEPVIIKREENIPLSSSSQPSLMAIMLEQLDLRPGHRVMEIGAATGYNAALMRHIVGPAGHVTTLDIDEDLVAGARANLAAAGFPDVEVITHDGGRGWPPGAPYDRIILTVAAWDIAPAWIEQLAPDGRMVIPLTLTGQAQESIAFEREGDHLASVSMQSCGFIHMRGEHTQPERRSVAIPPGEGATGEGEIHLEIRDGNGPDPAAISALLNGPHSDQSLGISATPREVFLRLMPWLELRVPDLAAITATGPMAASGIIPYLIGSIDRYCTSSGYIHERGAILLMRRPGAPILDGQLDSKTPFELWVRIYGDPPEGDLFLETILDWERSGRGSGGGAIGVRAYPHALGYTPKPGERAIDKEHVRLIITRR